MSHMMPEDIMETRRRLRNYGAEEPPAARLPQPGVPEAWPSAGTYRADSQQAGLAALMAIARRIDQDAIGHGASQHVANDQSQNGRGRDHHDRNGRDWDSQYGSAPGQPGGSRTQASGPAWLSATAPPGTGELPVLSPEADAARMASAAGREIVRRRVLDTGALALDVQRRAKGKVAEVTRHGPVIARDTTRRTLRRSTFAPALGRADRVIIAVLSVCWAICLADFWAWWLEPVHQTTVYGTVLNAIVLAYLTCFPVFFVVAINRLRNVSRQVAVPLLKVAFIVTRAPSEPWEVARATLEAMLDQDFPIPYDVWLADEKPDAQILSWCEENGVIVSTRNGVEDYHRPVWPRRTKCKEGNLAYFYDHWGYRSYDVVAQLDCDHKPEPTYLAEMVRPFSDPAVGYVAAPSVCDSNAAESWSARGRLYAEATFHGVFQLGHSAGWSPLCIGSHYAVRTAALRDIGGVGPELAEDFSTSFLMNTAGWHGAFAINAEAHGDGPNTFAAMLVQEFQWSKSLTVLLLRLVPRNLPRLDWAHRFRFIYALLYYSLLTLATVGGMLLAPVAAITGKPWMNVNYFAFLLHWWSLSVWLILMALVMRRRGLLRPPDAPLFSWENWLYMMVRWPYIARGVWAGIKHAVRPSTETFKVTPKGNGRLEVLPATLMAPYLLVSMVCAGSALIGESTNNAAGYVFLCILAAFLFAAVSALVPLLHAREMAARMNVPVLAALRETGLVPLILALAVAIPVVVAAVIYPGYAEQAFGVHLPTLLSTMHWNLRELI
jgi:cellulose synthase/poly-beta-1,6-N-acetylglucosamine synthase-like glycosyltransferase